VINAPRRHRRLDVLGERAVGTDVAIAVCSKPAPESASSVTLSPAGNAARPRSV
jgi:hypothetical protein